MLVALALSVLAGASAAADAPVSAAAAKSPDTPAPAKKALPATLVDINSATLTLLKTLPGIGDAEAARIVAGRPYLSKADLASKKVLPTGIYISLKNRIIARQAQQPKRKD